MLNKLKGRGVDNFTDSAAFDLESYTGSLLAVQTNLLVKG